MFLFIVLYPTVTTTILVNSEGSIGWIVGATAYIPILALVILVIVLHMKKVKSNQKR